MFERNKEKDYSYDIMLLKVFSLSPTVTLYYALYLLSLNYVSICSWRRKPSWINLWKLCLFLRKRKKHQLMLNAPLLVGGRKHQKENMHQMWCRKSVSNCRRTQTVKIGGSSTSILREWSAVFRWETCFFSVFLYYIILYYIILYYCINVFLCPSFSLGWFRKSSYLQY